MKKWSKKSIGILFASLAGAGLFLVALHFFTVQSVRSSESVRSVEHELYEDYIEIDVDPGYIIIAGLGYFEPSTTDAQSTPYEDPLTFTVKVEPRSSFSFGFQSSIETNMTTEASELFEGEEEIITEGSMMQPFGEQSSVTALSYGLVRRTSDEEEVTRKGRSVQSVLLSEDFLFWYELERSGK